MKQTQDIPGCDVTLKQASKHGMYMHDVTAQRVELSSRCCAHTLDNSLCLHTTRRCYSPIFLSCCFFLVDIFSFFSLFYPSYVPPRSAKDVSTRSRATQSNKRMGAHPLLRLRGTVNVSFLPTMAMYER